MRSPGRFRFILPLVLVLLVVLAVVTGPAVGNDTRMRSADALLGSPVTRGLMSAMFETKLLIMTGRLAGRAGGGIESPAGVPTSPTASIQAETDVLVSDPAADVGSSTTQSETTVRVNPDTGTICACWNDSQHWAQGSIGFTGFGRSTNGGLTGDDRERLAIDNNPSSTYYGRM